MADKKRDAWDKAEIIAKIAASFLIPLTIWYLAYRGDHALRTMQNSEAQLRLRTELLAVTIGGRSISEVCDASVAQAREFFEQLSFEGAAAVIAEQPLREIRNRLKFLQDVGIDYLSLSRSSASLSGGEAQRIRLATQIGSGLTGVCYVLDEPTIGLHQRDSRQLVKTLKQLTDSRNTVVVVEHDEDVIAAADHVIDVGLKFYRKHELASGLERTFLHIGPEEKPAGGFGEVPDQLGRTLSLERIRR